MKDSVLLAVQGPAIGNSTGTAAHLYLELIARILFLVSEGYQCFTGGNRFEQVLASADVVTRTQDAGTEYCRVDHGLQEQAMTQRLHQ
ncbi:hypothetical protein D3C85_1625070 [compost metagenome]